jgi:hypothetical protein
MRSRDMMVKLDRLETNSDDEEIKVWDLSLLSPEQQDRADELMALIREAIEQDTITGMEPVVREFDDLVRGLPLLGRDDREQGPLIEVPRDLAFYWTWRQRADGWRSYRFRDLTKVQTLRFVQLCEQYGYEAGVRGLELKARMIPLVEWQADDRAELQEMLGIVGSG